MNKVEYMKYEDYGKQEPCPVCNWQSVHQINCPNTAFKLGSKKVFEMWEAGYKDAPSYTPYPNALLAPQNLVTFVTSAEIN